MPMTVRSLTGFSIKNTGPPVEKRKPVSTASNENKNVTLENQLILAPWNEEAIVEIDTENLPRKEDNSQPTPKVDLSKNQRFQKSFRSKKVKNVKPHLIQRLNQSVDQGLILL